MNIHINVPDYTSGDSLQFVWDDNFEITVESDGTQTIIKANQAGLTSLARHLLTLAQQDIPAGYHLHLDDLNGLEDGSSELIIERA